MITGCDVTLPYSITTKTVHPYKSELNIMSETNLIQSPDKKNMTDFNKPSSNTQSILTQSKNTPSFASKVASEQLPKRELAIVFNTIENIPQIEYLIALSKLI